MPRAKKQGKFVNAYLRQDIVDRLDVYSGKTLIPKTAIIEIALEEYLDKAESSKTQIVRTN